MAELILHEPISLTVIEFNKLNELASTTLSVLAGAAERSEKEHRAAMRIIQALPPEDDGGGQ